MVELFQNGQFNFRLAFGVVLRLGIRRVGLLVIAFWRRTTRASGCRVRRRDHVQNRRVDALALEEFLHATMNVSQLGFGEVVRRHRLDLCDVLG